MKFFILSDRSFVTYLMLGLYWITLVIFSGPLAPCAFQKTKIERPPRITTSRWTNDTLVRIRGPPLAFCPQPTLWY